MILPPPRPTLFPYTTLFRSGPAPATRCAEATEPTAPERPGGGFGTRRPDRQLRTRVPHAEGSPRSEEHTSELQSLRHLVCRLLLEKKKKKADETTDNNVQRS